MIDLEAIGARVVINIEERRLVELLVEKLVTIAPRNAAVDRDVIAYRALSNDLDVLVLKHARETK